MTFRMTDEQVKNAANDLYEEKQRLVDCFRFELPYLSEEDQQEIRARLKQINRELSALRVSKMPEVA